MDYLHQVAANSPVKAASVDGRGERPSPRSSTGDCSVGKAQCCDQVINDESHKKTIAGLAGLNSIAGSIALVSKISHQKRFMPSSLEAL